MAKLVIYEEIEGQATVFEDFGLFTNRILIGAAPENHLVLDAPDIAPTHASLELRQEHWVLQDLGGPTGTYVNQKRIDGPYRLNPADLIEIGAIKMRFEADESGDESAAKTVETEAVSAGSAISGRLWFATLTGGTLAVIFIILFLLIVADVLGVLKIADLLPILGP